MGKRKAVNKAKKEKPENFGFFIDKPLKNSTGILTRSVMSVDQSYRSPGVCFLFVDVERSVLIDFAASVAFFFPRFSGLLESPLFTEGRTMIFTDHGNKRKKPRSYGHIFNVRPDVVNAVFYGALPITDEERALPEWMLSLMLANKIAELLAIFRQSNRGQELSLTLEGLAMGGISDAAASLPALGLLFGTMWQVLLPVADSVPGLRMKEIPISTWKKHFTGSGRADKKKVQVELARLGISEFETNDESDAVAMSLMESSLRLGKETRGRMRPIPNAVLKENSAIIELSPPKD